MKYFFFVEREISLLHAGCECVHDSVCGLSKKKREEKRESSWLCGWNAKCEMTEEKNF